MKTSRKWLQGYFDTDLPDAEALADALTFHVAEVEEAKGDLVDVNILPDRASYMLSHRGIASEIASALDLTLSRDPLKEEIPQYPSAGRVSVSLDEDRKCARYIGALVTGVSVGPSPDWLKDALIAVGQRSINNVVDATNYVMLDIGQPLHAFDAGKLVAREGAYAIKVRGAASDETITTLTGEEYVLPEGTLLITDGNDTQEAPLGIAGIKGGVRAKVDEGTTSILVEAASFDGSAVRKTSQALKLFTDASSRFQNKPSQALASYGMRDVLALIQKVAGGEVIDVVDVAEPAPEPRTVSVSLARTNALLGSSYTAYDVRGAFAKLGFSYTETEDLFVVLSPFERNDLVIAEDLVEEIGRTLGYDGLASEELPLLQGVPDQATYRGIERVRDFLIERGFAEISTQSFAAEGEIELENPLQSDRPFLRSTLVPNLKDALTRAATVAPRVLGPDPFVKLFEIGNVFSKSGESLVLSLGIVATAGKPATAANALKEYVATLEQELFQTPGAAALSLEGQMAEVNLSKLNLEKLGEEYAPVSVSQGAYRPFSPYPFALRDIAVWTPEGTEESEVTMAIIKEAGDYLARIDLFDRFEKEGRISYAFRLVFESMERTLADTDLDPAMQRITDSLNAKDGWEVR